MDVRFPKSPAVSWAALIVCTAGQQHSVCGIPTFTSAYVQCMSLAGRCRVRRDCGCLEGLQTLAKWETCFPMFQ